MAAAFLDARAVYQNAVPGRWTFARVLAQIWEPVAGSSARYQPDVVVVDVVHDLNLAAQFADRVCGSAGAADQSGDRRRSLGIRVILFSGYMR